MNESRNRDEGGLRHRESTTPPTSSTPEESESEDTALAEARERATAISDAAQSIVAAALSDDSTQFLRDVHQKGGE